MKTRKDILDKIKPILTIEKDKLIKATLNKDEGKIKLHTHKMKGLEQIETKLNDLAYNNIDEEWLKQTIANAAKEYPELTKGLTSTIKKLFNEIAPGWEKVQSVSSVASGITLFSNPVKLTEQKNEKSLFKVLLVGDIGVGKSVLMKQMVHGEWTAAYKSTIGADFGVKEVVDEKGGKKRIQLWDIAGQERFGNMLKVYARETDELIFVFDLSRASTLTGVKEYYKQLKAVCSNFAELPKILVANNKTGDIDEGADQLIVQSKQFAEENKIFHVVLDVRNKKDADDLLATAASQLGIKNKTNENRPRL